MKKSIIIISSLLMVSLVAGSVFARGQGKGQRMGAGYNQDCRGYGGQGIINDLSKEQRDELMALRQTFIDETYEVRAAKFQKKQEMRMLMETSEPDRAKLGKLSQELTDLQKQVRDKRIDFRLAAKKISPDIGMGRGYGKGLNRGSQKGHHGQGVGWHHSN